MGKVVQRETKEQKANKKKAAPKPKVHHGSIKWWRGSWGLIYCEEVAAMKLVQEDVFLHKSEVCGTRPVVGDKIRFCLEFDDFGKPKATKVSFEKDDEMFTLD